MAFDPKTEKQLVQEALGGDRTALQSLLLAHVSEIKKTISYRFNSELAEHLEIEDLVQEVFVDAQRGIMLYEQSESVSFVAWLHRLAENRVIDTVRHYRRLKRGGGRQRVSASNQSFDDSLDAVWEWACPDSDAASRALRNQEAREMIKVCLANLKTDQRQVVKAYYFDSLEIDEIAEEMGRTPAAVRELLRRARKKLAELFGTVSAWLTNR